MDQKPETNIDKWDYIAAIGKLSLARGDRYGDRGLLKLLIETNKLNTQQLTLEEAEAFWAGLVCETGADPAQYLPQDAAASGV